MMGERVWGGGPWLPTRVEKLGGGGATRGMREGGW